MPRSSKLTAASPLALDVGAATPSGAPPEALKGLEISGGADALARLNAAMRDLKAMAAEPLIQRAVTALNANDPVEGARWALKALDKDEQSGAAWYVLAFARERSGDFASSVQCFERALDLLPDHAQVANDLGRLAVRMGMREQAEKLFLHFIQRNPENPEGYNNLACVMRDEGRFDEAIAVVKAALEQHPENAMLWNTLGSVLSETGDSATARVFYEEALRLSPGFARARYNLATTRLALGEKDGALEDCDAALKIAGGEDDRQMMRLARATMLIELGRIGEGWEEYESRLHHQYDEATLFLIDRPRWSPGDDLAGKSLLVVGEQGLGDEILFANVLEDLVERLGPEGRLTLAVEKRLIPLFQRTYPQAHVGPHATYNVQARTVRVIPFLEDMSSIDLWTPIASALREYRRTVEDFPNRERFLTPDAARVAHWRSVLAKAPAGRKVGLLWKSAVKNLGRNRYFSAFEAWAPVLRTPGATFVNLQYGDCAAELEQARREFGVDIWSPPDIDLRNDLDDLAALCCAADLVLGFSNATFNIAAACGAPTWLISTPGSWPRLGTNRYPWYPQVRPFIAQSFGDWDPVMADVAQALAGFVKRGTGASPKG